MSEWLDLMLEEIDRKQQERREALDESARRGRAVGAEQEAPSRDKADSGGARQAER